MFKKPFLLMILTLLLCILGGSALADIIITPVESARTEGADRADDNRHDSKKLTVRASSRGNKSWIKFDLGDLDVSNVLSAWLSVSLHEGKGGDQSFDVSYVNDDYLDNIGWDERSITWNNAPGNDTADLGLLDPAMTTLLGTVNFTDGLAGDSFAVDVLGALQTDTDGIVQFVLHNSPNNINLSTHDHPTEAQRPFLDVTMIPEPTTLVLLGLGGLMAARRRR